ncbi:3'-5' exonuclease [Bacillus seohaeanensis]|jgi:DNA polymerase III subunit epsilon|uniref:PolC-type DNA polymerase III n=1 Tax=Bacillus seohaeanensis TaxID=284580 RepID=A0ABW5RUD4_9BACI
MNDIGINVGFRIIKYYIWQQFFFHYQVKKAKESPSYDKLTLTMKEFEKDKPTFQKKPLSDCTFTIFDLETTGFFPEIGDEIISIGAVKVKDQQVNYEDSFYQVINPLQTVSKETKMFTGLRRKDFLSGVTFPVGLEKFLEFSKGTILVAHPASFDINFLQSRMQKWRLPSFDPEYIDSFGLANELLDCTDSYLDKLVERYRINSRKRHHALNDAIMTAEVFIKLLQESKATPIKTIHDLKEQLA